jgi:hypothetical protein
MLLCTMLEWFQLTRKNIELGIYIFISSNNFSEQMNFLLIMYFLHYKLNVYYIKLIDYDKN